jgi:uncharacterized Fe-S cluster-containing protein
MTHEEILRMAESAGFYLVDFIDDDKSVTEQIQADNSELLYSFAALVAAAEREACAKFLIDLYESDGGYHPAEEFTKQAVNAIRARGV